MSKKHGIIMHGKNGACRISIIACTKTWYVQET